ncbi:O-antigen ligase family protein, partial [Salibacteraceae bacterium]|nr:O-antigen ligase family protein [Salibacteraceae bacterium]
MISSVKKLSLKSIWALLWMACVFLYTPLVSDAGYLPKLIGFSLITFLGFVFFWRSLKLDISDNYGLVLLGLIIVFSLPSVFISTNLGDALLTITRWTLVILLVSVFSIKMDTSNLKAFTIKAASLVLLALSLWGMQEWFFALEDFVLTHKATYSVTASLGHRNLYIQYLVLLMPFAAAGLFLKGWWQKISMASVALSLFLVIVLLNRTAWFTVAIYAVSAFLGFACLKQGSLIGRKKELIALSGFLGVSLIIAVLLVDDVYTFTHQFETVFDFSKGTSRDRFLLAQRSFSLFLEHPFIGVGSGMWKIDIMGFSQEGMLTTSANLFY